MPFFSRGLLLGKLMQALPAVPGGPAARPWLLPLWAFAAGGLGFAWRELGLDSPGGEAPPAPPEPPQPVCPRLGLSGLP